MGKNDDDDIYEEHIEELLERYNSDSKQWFDLEDIVELGSYFEGKEDYQSYNNILKEGERLYPDNSLIKLMRVKSLVNESKFEEASKLYDSVVIEKDEDDSILYYILCLSCLVSLSRIDDAEEIARCLVSHVDVDSTALYDYAVMFREIELWQLSYIFYEALYDETEMDEDVTLGIMHCCFYLSMYEQALMYCEQLIRINPYKVDFWMFKALIDHTLTRFDDELEDVEYAIAIEDSDLNLKYRKAWLLVYIGRSEEARLYTDEINNRYPKETNHCNVLRAESYYSKNDAQTAYSYFSKVRIGKSYTLTSIVHYFHCCIELKLWKKAVNIGERILKDEPNMTYVLFHISFAYEELGKIDKALKVLKKCYKQMPDDKATILRYAVLLIDMFEFKKAEVLLRKLCDIAPNDFLPHIWLSYVYAVLHSDKKMYKHFCRAYELNKEACLTFCSEKVIIRRHVVMVEKNGLHKSRIEN